MVVQSIIPYSIYVHVCRALAQSTEATKSARLLRTSTELLLQIRLLLPLELLLSELLLNTRLCPVAPVSMLPYAVEDEESKQVLDNAEEKRCRLCLGGDEDGPLVQPCACRGTAKWVHNHCLEAWRRTSPKVDAAFRCGQCKDHYRDALSLELLSARLQAKRAKGERTSSTLGELALELKAQGKYERIACLQLHAKDAAARSSKRIDCTAIRQLIAPLCPLRSIACN